MNRSCVPRGHTAEKCFQLIRSWGPYRPSRWVHVIHLRPGKANGLDDDALTIRTVEVAEALGYSGVVMSFLFPYRAWKWEDLLALPDPTGGAENDAWIDRNASFCRDHLACWGDQGTHLDRDIPVWARHRPMDCLGFTMGRNPQILKNIDVHTMLRQRFWIDPRERDLTGAIRFYER